MSPPRLLQSIHGKGVIHVASWHSGRGWSRAQYDTACGRQIAHPVMGSVQGPPTCKGCRQALHLDTGDLTDE